MGSHMYTDVHTAIVGEADARVLGGPADEAPEAARLARRLRVLERVPRRRRGPRPLPARRAAAVPARCGCGGCCSCSRGVAVLVPSTLHLVVVGGGGGGAVLGVVGGRGREEALFVVWDALSGQTLLVLRAVVRRVGSVL